MNEGIARDVLEKERARLVMARSALTKRLIEDQSRLTPLDRAESAPDLDQLEVALAVRGIIDDDLRAIDDALDRVNAGTYGACAACGSPIDDERLAAVPATALCVHHEGIAELDVIEQSGVFDGPLIPGAPPLRMESPRGHGALAEAETDEDSEELPNEEAAVHVQLPG